MVAEVETGGAVGGIFEQTGEAAGGQDCALAPVFAGQVDREAHRVELSPAQQMRRVIRRRTTAQQLARRARVVLQAADGWAKTEVVDRVGVDAVRKWLHRWWVEPRTASLGDARRSGAHRPQNPV